jgi:hypothetical protein
MFDFYADAYNYVSLRGSDATVALLSYTATFGDGFSGTLSFEDPPSRRAAIGSTIASTTAAPPKAHASIAPARGIVTSVISSRVAAQMRPPSA